jgi:hypothetical protein
MSFPEKFRALIELREEQVTVPDYVWLAYAVCAVEWGSCGWRGWIIESACKLVGENLQKVEVEADTEQGCPVCGRQLYRTGVAKQFRLNPDAESEMTSYETVPPKFAKAKPTGRRDERLRFLKPLSGRSFRFTRWQSSDPEWTHDHCRGCRAHICDSNDDDYHEGFVTSGVNGVEDWVCPKCFGLYQLALNFKLQNSSPE